MNESEIENTAAFHAHELGLDDNDAGRRWESYVTAIEKDLELTDLDGNQAHDGFSLDQARDYFDDGADVAQAVAEFRESIEFTGQVRYQGEPDAPDWSHVGRVLVMHGGALDSAIGELDPRTDIYNHSPTGFAWGYAGSGPAQLALAILADTFGDDALADRHHQAFKNDVVVSLPRDTWSITRADVRAWYAIRERGESTAGIRAAILNAAKAFANCQGGTK